MLVAKLTTEIEEFTSTLLEYSSDWWRLVDESSLVPTVPTGSGFTELFALQSTHRSLAIKLGMLRPYLERFDQAWQVEQSGRTWNVLDAAVSYRELPYKKQISVEFATGKLCGILGTLHNFDKEHDVPLDPDGRIGPPSVGNLQLASYLSHLHHCVSRASARLFIDEHFSESVEAACKAVSGMLRDATGSTEDGVALAQLSFSPKNPKLYFSERVTKTEKSEQEGFMQLLVGLQSHARNPISHAHAREEEPQIAFEYLVMASLLCRRIDDAKAYSSSHASL